MATISGTLGNDILKGGNDADIINGLAATTPSTAAPATTR